MALEDRWYQVRAPGFMAGVKVEQGRVVKASPDLKQFVGKDVSALMSWCKRNNCTVLELGARHYRVILGKE